MKLASFRTLWGRLLVGLICLLVAVFLIPYTQTDSMLAAIVHDRVRVSQTAQDKVLFVAFDVYNEDGVSDKYTDGPDPEFLTRFAKSPIPVRAASGANFKEFTAAELAARKELRSPSKTKSTNFEPGDFVDKETGLRGDALTISGWYWSNPFQADVYARYVCTVEEYTVTLTLFGWAVTKRGASAASCPNAHSDDEF